MENLFQRLNFGNSGGPIYFDCIVRALSWFHMCGCRNLIEPLLSLVETCLARRAEERHPLRQYVSCMRILAKQHPRQLIQFINAELEWMRDLLIRYLGATHRTTILARQQLSIFRLMLGIEGGVCDWEFEQIAASIRISTQRRNRCAEERTEGVFAHRIRSFAVAVAEQETWPRFC